MDIQRRFHELKSFLFPFEKIWQNEVLNSYPFHEDPYPREWIDELSSLSLDEIYRLDGQKDISLVSTPSLRDFLQKTLELRKVPEAPFAPSSHLDPTAFLGVRPKKVHELQRLSHEILRLRGEWGFSHMVDWGGGRGLLAQLMANYYHLPVCSLDQDREFQERGRARNLKYYREGAPLVEFIPVKIEDNQGLWSLRERLEGDVLSLGLHTCGDLGRIHLQSVLDISPKILLNFGCCYYRMGEKMGFLSEAARGDQFTVSALTLATRAHGRISLATFRHKIQVKLYRYHFHLLLKDQLLHDRFENLGDSRRDLYYGGFPSYARQQFKRIQFPDSVVSDRELRDFYEDRERQQVVKRMIVCGVVRSFFGRLLELYVLLDRALFLLEKSEKGTSVQVYSYFDEDLSPRNIGILGVFPGIHLASASGISPS